ncbi:NADP-dependent aldehyde dehydrogenase [Actinopolyspora alba]|uniref:NADP-dependent aldehyde dehydrogenase n=1 Tax=Actinopolyspora alba TaxID=673379 RepID=A0A1I1TQA8_9ACTN|nr:aldehyde dehydrogenase (NADP(+)) [Actinopolyspora alba]SFD60684.1 NADP-dependent aldehyde dehydrogenase [Actinopolyspora alba]
MTRPTGHMLVAGTEIAGKGAGIRAVDPATGQTLEPEFGHGSPADVDRACTAAEEAFPVYRAAPRNDRAALLDRIADNIDALNETLVERAHSESGLPKARLTGEVGRTTGQLRMFASLVRQGDLEAPRVDPSPAADGSRSRPDIRQRRIPLGPVAVFGASNFPLAFSVAGGDTTSALAAGCPVVVKAHDAHPGTCELVARAVTRAVTELDMPAGTFSMLFGSGPELGTALVTDPRIQAVGFTGSRSGGLALLAAAQSRPRPIPVFAEMSSTNPVFLLPNALAERAGDIATGFVGSLTSGAGQFCTNPGLVVAVDGPELREFLSAAADSVAASEPSTMLTPDIAHAYADRLGELAAHPSVEELARGTGTDRPNTCRPALLATDAGEFLADESLHQEVFGACSLVVRCRDAEQLREVARNLEGQLTATVHAATADHPEAAALLPLLERCAGRVLFDGWPTGVQVGHAMVHGGPFPATSDSRGTSVGTLAVERFLRPVAYQDVPEALLPDSVAPGNPEQLWRRVDGEPGRH